MTEVAGFNPTPHRFPINTHLSKVDQIIPFIFQREIGVRPTQYPKKVIEARYEHHLTLSDFESLAEFIKLLKAKDDGLLSVNLYAGLRDYGELIDPEFELFQGCANPSGHILSLLILLEPMPLDLDASQGDLAKHLFSCYSNLTPDQADFFNKMFFSATIQRSNLKTKLESLRKISPSEALTLHPLIPLRRQSSGSCVLKNLQAALAHTSSHPSYIIRGGFYGHVTYIEIIKGEDGVFFGLLHNLGAGRIMHPKTNEGKFLPLGFVFENEEQALQFLLEYTRISKDKKSYLSLIEKAIPIDQTPKKLRGSDTNRAIVENWTTEGLSIHKSSEFKTFKKGAKKITLAFLEIIRPDLRQKHRIFYSRKKILYSSKDIDPYIEYLKSHDPDAENFVRRVIRDYKKMELIEPNIAITAQLKDLRKRLFRIKKIFPDLFYTDTTPTND